MRMTMILAAMVLSAMIAMPALAELTDYQKGVEEGLKIGFFMGNLSGAGAGNAGFSSAEEKKQSAGPGIKGPFFRVGVRVGIPLAYGLCSYSHL